MIFFILMQIGGIETPYKPTEIQLKYRELFETNKTLDIEIIVLQITNKEKQIKDKTNKKKH